MEARIPGLLKRLKWSLERSSNITTSGVVFFGVIGATFFLLGGKGIQGFIPEVDNDARNATV